MHGNVRETGLGDFQTVVARIDGGKAVTAAGVRGGFALGVGVGARQGEAGAGYGGAGGIRDETVEGGNGLRPEGKDRQQSQAEKFIH